jgi:hypothetical protein
MKPTTMTPEQVKEKLDAGQRVTFLEPLAQGVGRLGREDPRRPARAARRGGAAPRGGPARGHHRDLLHLTARGIECPCGTHPHGTRPPGRAYARRRLRRLAAGGLPGRAEGMTPEMKETAMAHERYRSCIDACAACAQECEHCGDACIGQVEMAECVRTCRDCAGLCWTCSGFMSRGSQLVADVCRACARACDLCAAECKKHQAEHCKRCAEACRRCAEECRKVAA